LTAIVEGGFVLLYFDVRRQWLLRVERGKEFHTHKGFLKTDNIIGLPLGSQVRSSLGERFWLLKPTTHDFIMHSVRRTQIMYPKDIGIILLKLSLSSGLKVLEIGTGSGAMTVAVASAVKPSGRVHTYEARDEFADIAERNLRRASVWDYVTVHRADASTGIEGDDFDAAIVDVGDPWPLIPKIHRALRGGAPFVSFSPTMNQVEKTTETLGKTGFVNVHTLECFVREIRADTGKTRPATMMIGHTGYMTFAQKILLPESSTDAAAVARVSDVPSENPV
jgi:tRNA (adenine57-N1/adenine58-N1)-methyltransferase catalytic subunit